MLPVTEHNRLGLAISGIAPTEVVSMVQLVSVGRKPVPERTIVVPGSDPTGGEPEVGVALTAGFTVKPPDGVEGSPWSPITVTVYTGTVPGTVPETANFAFRLPTPRYKLPALSIRQNGGMVDETSGPEIVQRPASSVENWSVPS